MDPGLVRTVCDAASQADRCRLEAALQQCLGAAAGRDPRDGATPLHHAAAAGSEGCVQALLDAGADTAAADQRGRTALHVAVSKGQLRCVHALLRAGASPDAADAKDRWTPVHLAAASGRMACLRALLQCRPAPRLEAGDSKGRTAAFLAAEKGQEAALRAVLGAGGSPEVVADSGQAPLHAAVAGGHAACLAALLEAGADAEAMGDIGQTALMLAASAGLEGCIAALAAGGASLEAADDGLGHTAVHYAAAAGQAGALQALLQAGASADAADFCGWRPMHAAAGAGAAPCVRILLDAGADPDAATTGSVKTDAAGNKVPLGGQTPLHRAALKGHLSCVHELLKGGASPAATAPRGWTALHFAVHGGSEACLRLLLAAASSGGGGGEGAAAPPPPPRSLSHGWRSPLHLAASSGAEGCLRALLEAGHVADVGDHRRRTPLMYAAEAGAEACLQTLLQAGSADPNAVDAKGRTALMAAAGAGRGDACVAALLAAGAGLEAANAKGWRALHLAAKANSLSAVQRLVAAGASLAAQTADGRTAMEVARGAGAAAAAELLQQLASGGSGTARPAGAALARQPTADSAWFRSGGSGSSSIYKQDPLLFWVTHLLENGLTTPFPGAQLQALQARKVEFEELQMQRCIGEGAFGRCYLAKYHETQVAVKVLLNMPGASPTAQPLSLCDPALADLRKEAGLMCQLGHPNIVPLIAVCAFPAAIITEYCSRGSLLNILKEARCKPVATARLPWRRRLSLAIGAAKGMLYLHTRQPQPVLHRDLKSGNLVVDGQWRIKVCDFNMSKPQDLDKALSSVFNNINPLWTAPEVLEGQPATTASDVYSYGIVLWELLTWQFPWGEKLTWQQQCALGPAIIQGRRPEVPPLQELPGEDTATFAGLDAYVALMRRCWAADPADRPGFANIIPELRSMLPAGAA